MAAQGMDELVKKAIEGFTGSAGVMPAKGGNPALTDDQLLDAMLATPVLINRPIVVTPQGARLGRPLERVLEVL